MMMPLLHPGVWSAVGLNDASVWAGCADVMFGRGPVGEQFQAIELFADYASLSGVTRARIQIGIAIARTRTLLWGSATLIPPHKCRRSGRTTAFSIASR